MDDLFRLCLPSSNCNWCNCSKLFTQKSHSKQRQGPSDRLPDSTRSPACPVAPPTSGPCFHAGRGEQGRTTFSARQHNTAISGQRSASELAGNSQTKQNRQPKTKGSMREKNLRDFPQCPITVPQRRPNHIDHAAPQTIEPPSPKTGPFPGSGSCHHHIRESKMKQAQSQKPDQETPNGCRFRG